MKKIILTLLILLLSFMLIGDGARQIYRHFGTVNFNKGYNTKVSIEAYITKKVIDDYNRKSLVEYKYIYEVMLVSHSLHNGVLTNAWLDGTRIFLNGRETSAKTYPNGFTVLVKQEPTVIYWLEMDDIAPNITIRWASAKYEPIKQR